MIRLIILVAVLGLVVFAVSFILIGKRPKLDWPVRAKPLLTPAEQTLFRRLCEAFPDHFVFAQVALSQLIDVDRVPNRRSVFNRFSQLVADFVLCTKALAVVAVIELDDSSHDREGRRATDAKKAGVLEAAGYRLVRFRVSKMPNTADARAQILEAMAGKQADAEF
jgi:very-short-patch-repair endonuclease